MESRLHRALGPAGAALRCRRDGVPRRRRPRCLDRCADGPARRARAALPVAPPGARAALQRGRERHRRRGRCALDRRRGPAPVVATRPVPAAPALAPPRSGARCRRCHAAIDRRCSRGRWSRAQRGRRGPSAALPGGGGGGRPHVVAARAGGSRQQFAVPSGAQLSPPHRPEPAPVPAAPAAGRRARAARCRRARPRGPGARARLLQPEPPRRAVPARGRRDARRGAPRAFTPRKSARGCAGS